MHPRIFAKSNPDNMAVLMADGSDSLSYGNLEIRANKGAHYLRSIDIESGDTIAIWLHNCVEFFELYWTAQRTGIYICPISTQLNEQDVAYILNDSGAKLLVTDPSVKSAALLIDGKARLAPKTLILQCKSWSNFIDQYPSKPIADESAGYHMVYSSGTTGKPKGIRTALADTAVEAPSLRAEVLSKKYGFDHQSVLLCPAPLYHTAPLIFSTVPQRMGSTIVLMPKFDPKKLLQWIEEYQVTFVQMVPTMFIRLIKLEKAVRERHDLSSLKTVLHAAAPCPIEVKHAMLDWMGPIVYEYYAGSEGNGSTSIGPEEWLRKPGSVGKTDMGIIHICDEAGQELHTGETGLIYFEGGNEFEYLNDLQKTVDARHPLYSGWTTLGDIGHLDENGYLYLTDRKSFTIISGGVNIYPQETENLLIQHPEVADVAVIGIPNPVMGEEVKAIVQPVRWEDSSEDLAERLMVFCCERLSRFKCPKSIDFDRQLPRHENGKLYKQELKRRYWPSANKINPR